MKYFISFNHSKVKIFLLHIWLFLIITLIINLIVCQKHGQRVNNMLYHNNTCRCAQVWMMSLIRIFNFRLTLILTLLYQMCQIRITIISQLVCQKHVKGLIHGWHHNNMQVCYSLKDVINQNTQLQTSD